MESDHGREALGNHSRVKGYHVGAIHELPLLYNSLDSPDKTLKADGRLVSAKVGYLVISSKSCEGLLRHPPQLFELS